jgi:hypothetical protein
MSRTKRFFGAWFFPGVLIMLGSLALYLGVNDMVKGWTSHGWPSVEGVVIQSKIGLNAGKIGNSKQGEDQTFYADIRYAYAVGSEQHEG